MLFFLTFNSSKNPKTYHDFHKIEQKSLGSVMYSMFYLNAFYSLDGRYKDYNMYLYKMKETSLVLFLILGFLSSRTIHRAANVMSKP